MTMSTRRGGQAFPEQVRKTKPTKRSSEKEGPGSRCPSVSYSAWIPRQSVERENCARRARRSKLSERAILDTLLGKREVRMDREGGARAFCYLESQLNMSALVL